MFRRLTVAAVCSGLAACWQPSEAAHPHPRPTLDAELIPARLRRLSNAEYEQAASELLSTQLRIQPRLPPDMRQEGFTVNAAQTLTAAHATRLSSLASELAHEAARERLTRLVPCAESPSEACARTFVTTFARRAFRRPPTAEERRLLLGLFHDGMSHDRGFAGGVELVLHALLESPSFLYISELGEERSPGVRRLSSVELSSSLAFTVRGGPPDEELLLAGERGELGEPRARVAQARRLLGMSDTRHHFRRFVLEWLEVDNLENTAKSPEIAANFEQLKGPMLDETRAFVDEVMVHEGASLRSLLTAGFASVDEGMARFYGLDAYGPRVGLEGSGRLGILQHSSFLAAHAHEDSTSPVKRGDFVMRKLLCSTLPRPAELNIEVTMPPPDPNQTTRERFTDHVSNKSCQACHGPIDALGFTFENFDAAGRLQARQNDRSISTKANFEYEDQRRSFVDSLDLARWLADNPTSRLCFARHAFRYFSAQSDPRLEPGFLKLVEALPQNKQESLVEILLAYVESDLFAWRGAPR